MFDDDLQQAKNLAKAGRKAEARQIATRLVRQDKDNVAAWVVLAQVVDTRAQAIDCLKQVLRLEPGHPWATIHLNRLEGQAEARRAAPAPPPPVEPTPMAPEFADLDTPTPPPGAIEEMLRDVPRAPDARLPEADLDPLAGTTPWERPPSTMDVDTFDAFREEVGARKKGRKGAPGARRVRWLPLVLLFILFVLIGGGLIFAMQTGLLGGFVGPAATGEAGPTPTLAAEATTEPTEPPTTAEVTGEPVGPTAEPTPTEEPVVSTEEPGGVVPGPTGQILFYRDTGGPVSLFLIGADGSAETPLDPGVEARPDLGVAWSHDGSRIAFVGYTDPDGDGILAGDIFVMNADASNVLNLTQSADDDVWPEWSPDGQFIAFVSNTAEGAHIGIVPVSAEPDPAADTAADAPAVILATPGSQPAWSPDARSIAFATLSAVGSDIALLDVECALGRAACEINPTPLTTDGLGNERPEWSRDGARLAFISLRDDGPDLWVMGADGAGLTRLTTTALPITSLAWSPDGARLAFELFDVAATDVDLYLANADGSGVSVLVDAPTHDSAPAWSPDGQLIAFQSTSEDQTLSDIYLIRADGTGLTQLTTDPALDLLPLWQP